MEVMQVKVGKRGGSQLMEDFGFKGFKCLNSHNILHICFFT